MFRRQKFSVGAIVKGAVALAKGANQSGKAGLKTKFKTTKTINVIMFLCLCINDSQNLIASYKSFIKIDVK